MKKIVLLAFLVIIAIGHLSAAETVWLGPKNFSSFANNSINYVTYGIDSVEGEYLEVEVKQEVTVLILKYYKKSNPAVFENFKNILDKVLRIEYITRNLGTGPATYPTFYYTKIKYTNNVIEAISCYNVWINL